MKNSCIIFLVILVLTGIAFGTTGFDSEKFVSVSGGTFLMGSSSGDNDERPVHEVTLNYDFIIGKYEVTFVEYDAYCDELLNEKPFDEEWGRKNRPVINVSWNDAIKYCNWLSEKENLPVAYDENGKLLDSNGNPTTDITTVSGYRLPTEAEWEYAALGGNKTNHYKYSGSNNINTVAWYEDNSEDHAHEVGEKAPNELGIYDMTGNVWELCNDWYGKYDESNNLNPIGPSEGSRKVCRGGSWYNSAENNCLANRGRRRPNEFSYKHGFRICRTYK